MPVISSRQPGPFWEAVQEGKKVALETIARDYDSHSPSSIHHLDFHGQAHTRQVVEVTEAILEIVRAATGVITEIDVGLGVFSAAFHDAIQQWSQGVVLPGADAASWREVRRRTPGESELQSISLGHRFMDSYRACNEDAGFLPHDYEVVDEAISATIPEWDADLLTVRQPNLTPSSSLVARAVALADVSAVGFFPPERFRLHGDALFREDNLDIKLSLRPPGGLEIPTFSDPDRRQHVRSRMLEWTRGQYWFAVGRNLLNEEVISGFPSAAAPKIRRLFRYGNQQPEFITELVRRRAGMDFAELLRDFGYDLAGTEI